MNKKIIVANWKMNPPTPKEAEELFDFYGNSAREIGKNNIIICPPFVYLNALSKIPSNLKLGAQNCHWENFGPFTGEISPAMLKNFGVEYIILGHSERRWIIRENDSMINKKIKAVLRNEMTPILAVGELWKEDNRSLVLIDQLGHDLDEISSDDIKKIIIAYEPVWSISTVSGGEVETPEHAIEAFGIIKNILRKITGEEITVPILYGGSVDSKNVAEFLSKPEIDGVLVGGASIKKEEFGKIIEIVSKI